jgi:uncharacterized membrane protein YhaH (DUF805 family)
MARLDAERIRFLYRTDQGHIDRATWRRGALALAGVLAPFTLIWLALEPYTAHDLAKSPLWVPMTAAAYAYLLFYALIVLLVAISFVNLSAKRFRDRGWPAPLALAGLFPFAALLDGAAHWYPLLVEEAAPRWHMYPFDAALTVTAIWTLVELGFRDEK